MATKYYQDDSTSTFSPQLMKSIQETNKNNAGTHIAKLFDDLGNVEEYKYKKQEEAKDKAVKQEIDTINLDAIKNQAQDKQNFMKYVKLGVPLEESGLDFKTPEYYSLANDFGKKEKTLSDADAIKYNYSEANRLFAKDGAFDENAFYTHMDNKLKNKEINDQVYAEVIDGVNKARKGGIYKEKTDSSSIYTTDYKNHLLQKIDPSFNPNSGYGSSSGSGGSTNEIKNYKAYKESMIADGKTPKPYYSWIEDKDLNKNMGMGIKDMTYVDGLVNKALESGDPIEKANAANKYRNINKDASEADKYFRGLQPTTFQLDEAQKLVQKGGAGAGDEIKNQFSVWTGLDWDNTTQEGRTAFLSVLQPLAKASMTGTASDRDMKTLESSFATLYQSDKAVANALKNKAKALLFTAKTYQQAHPTYAELRGYDRSINMLEKIADDKPTSKTEEKDKKINIIYDGRNPNSPDPKQQEQPQTINKPSWKDYE
jgi:hypothetical protein